VHGDVNIQSNKLRHRLQLHSRKTFPPQVNDGAMADGVREQITRTLWEFGFTPKGHARTY
jgi:hypothetical protein